MTNTKLIFLSSEDDNSSELECFLNTSNEITINIKDPNRGDFFSYEHVSLDLPTAIKLSKVLRSGINKGKEVLNG